MVVYTKRARENDRKNIYRQWHELQSGHLGVTSVGSLWKLDGKFSSTNGIWKQHVQRIWHTSAWICMHKYWYVFCVLAVKIFQNLNSTVNWIPFRMFAESKYSLYSSESKMQGVNHCKIYSTLSRVYPDINVRVSWSLAFPVPIRYNIIIWCYIMKSSFRRGALVTNKGIMQGAS